MEEVVMSKFAALALVGTLGIAGIGNPKPAEAGVVVGVGIGLPGVAVAPPVFAYPPAVGVYPYYYGRPYFYRPGFIRYGYGYGFRGYGFHGSARGRWR
jgi:hypothetical protein